MISSLVVARFSIDRIHEAKNFRSLLYYLGLVTIENENGKPMLKIPNYTAKTMYWEYMENMLTDRHPELSFNPSLIREGLTALAFDDEYERFFDVFQQKFVSQLSAQDMKDFTEKHIKFMQAAEHPMAIILLYPRFGTRILSGLFRHLPATSRQPVSENADRLDLGIEIRQTG